MVRYQQSLAQREQGIVAWEVLVDQDEQEMIPTAQQQYELQMQMAESILYTASSNPDILYLHEAMRAPNFYKQWNMKSKDMKKEKKTMGPSTEAPGTERYKSVGCSLVHVMQALNQISRDL